MIPFLDTSALVKRYIEEPGSGSIQACLTGAKSVAVSRLAYPETLSALHRRRGSLRECSDDDFSQLVATFRRDWRHFTVIDMNADTMRHMDRVIETYRLRGADSIHLSAALWLENAARSPVLFVAADRELLAAAEAERLKSLDPTD